MEPMAGEPSSAALALAELEAQHDDEAGMMLGGEDDPLGMGGGGAEVEGSSLAAVALPKLLPSSILDRRQLVGHFVEYLLEFGGRGRPRTRFWVDVVQLPESFPQESDVTDDKLAIVEMVEVFDAENNVDLSVLAVVDDKEETSVPTTLYKIMWADYPDAFCNWEMLENMGRDSGKVTEYLDRKRNSGSGYVSNPCCAATRPFGQAPVMAVEGEFDDAMDLDDEADDGTDTGRTECPICFEKFKLRGLNRHISARHSTESKALPPQRGQKRAAAAQPSPVQPASPVRKKKGRRSESGSLGTAGLPAAAAAAPAAAALQSELGAPPAAAAGGPERRQTYADLLVLVSSTKDWNLFAAELCHLVDRTDTHLVEHFWKKIVEGIDYPGRSQKPDVPLMVNFFRVKCQKISKYVRKGKWNRACVLCIVLAHLLQPLCFDIRNLTDGNRLQVRKMLKRLENTASAAAIPAGQPKLHRFLQDRIAYMKQYV